MALKTEVPRDPAHIGRILEECWSAETSSRWSAATPSRGQCSVTALVLNDHLGGDILKTRVGDSWHFYNRLGGLRLDATAAQFAEPVAYTDLPSNREEALADCTPEQYRTLSRGFSAALSRMPAPVH